MRNILFFSKKELAVILAVGLATGLVDDKLELVQFTLVARIHPLLLLNDFLDFKAGGPIFGDLLETWLEYGAVLAACLVRKPGAGTLALTVNGFCQVFAYGTHDPHLLYGVPGLGADIVFASFRYRRYDAPVVCLAGIACAMFWYPIVWFTHGLYLFPVSFILPDLAIRIGGSAVGDGLIAGALALLFLSAVGRRWDELPALAMPGRGLSARAANVAGVAGVSAGVIIIALTGTLSSFSGFFQGIGPDIPGRVAMLEEYNPGYVLGVVVIFLALTFWAFWVLRSRIFEQGSPPT